jgi:large subunit ribosomal protein L25
MKTQELNSEYRSESGKGASRKLRSMGRIPAVLYGLNEDTIPLTVSELEFRRVLSSNWETAILDLTVTGKVSKECNAIIKDIQQHPSTGRVLHVDFQYIRKGQKIRLEVPVVLTGVPVGVKEMGGILEHGSRALDIRCMPRHIPEKIEIDVSALGIQEGIHLKDIADGYPDLEFLSDPELTIANVVPPKVEVAATEEEEEAGEEEPEVIAKGKEEKEGEGEGGDESAPTSS